MSYRPDEYDKKQIDDALDVQAKCPRQVIMYGVATRKFWAFGTLNGRPLYADTAGELIAQVQAMERERAAHYVEVRPPRTSERWYVT